MRLLLDTHAFLWFAWQDSRLSTPAAAAIRDPNNEMAIKIETSRWHAVLASIGCVRA